MLRRTFAPFGRLTDFKGRDRPADFWPYIVLLTAVGVVSVLIASSSPPTPYTSMPLWLSAVALLLIFLGLAATVRRFHDVGWSGLWVHIGALFAVAIVLGSVYGDYLLSIGTCPGCFGSPLGVVPWLLPLLFMELVLGVLIVCLCLLDGRPGPNRFGPDPGRAD